MSATISLFRLTSCAALAASVLMASAPARGQTTTASALFQEAKELMNTGSYDRACPKLQEAQRLYPTAGTLLTLGDCLEHAGKLASSWGAFKEAEVMARNAKDADREREAQRRSGLLAPKLAKLTLIVPPAARVSGFELRRDGVVVGDAQWGSPLPIDAGPHTVETSAPGRKPWSTVVRIESNGSTASVEVPVMDAAPKESAGDASAWRPQRIAGVAIASVGAVSLVVGGVLGIVAIVGNNASKVDCRPNEPNICNRTGYDLRYEAGRFADASTATFIAGGVALVGGAVLFFTDRPPADAKGAGARLEIRPLLSAQTVGVSFSGWW